MAIGGRSTAKRGGGMKKSHPHKRRRGGATSNNIKDADSEGATRNAVRHQRKRYRDRRVRGRINRNPTTPKNDRRDIKEKNCIKQNGAKPKGVLPAINVRPSGIMMAWKKSLGGLIRYYVYKRMEGPEGTDQTTAEEEIDRMYYKCRCSVEDTKMAILEALGVSNGTMEWVDVSMAVEKDDTMANVPTAVSENLTEEKIMEVENPSSGALYKQAVDRRGILLNQLLRPGDGPAHCHEQWNTIVVPQWAVGKSYYFQVKNNSPLDLSCELFLDGEQVAFNAPVAANSTRTIRPDGVRYYQRHQWILNDAKRVKLGSVRNNFDSTNSNLAMQQLTPAAPRYNGVRPDYQGERMRPEQYPDPTSFGWKFTGSVQQSRVEFFEKKMNDGGIVKLDLYYTTGTVKTVLDHPTRGRNQLFRAQVSPEEYTAILENPRKHTGKGYRRKEDRPSGGNNSDEEKVYDDDDDEFDRLTTKPTENETMDTEDAQDGRHEVSAQTKYFARDENYDFKTQGHQNRRDHMNKLQRSGDYVQWREASKKEYAVIYAKFYVSISKRMYRSPTKAGNGGQRKVRQMESLPVPEQAIFVDIKAAENCTLGTKYHTTGPSQVAGRSNVQMTRINGLTDDKAYKGDPVFEKKLYYRAENIISGNGLDDDIDDEMMSEDGDNQVNIPDPLLAEYKTEKIEQVNQYYSDLNGCGADEEEAEQLLRNVKNKIHLSECIEDVDESVNMFYSDLIHRQFDSNGDNEMSC